MIIDVVDFEGIADGLGQTPVTLLLVTQPSSCAPCRAFEPHYEAAAARMPEVTFLRVNIDNVKTETLFDMMNDLGFMGVPTLFAYKGDERTTISARTAIALMQEVQGLLDS